MRKQPDSLALSGVAVPRTDAAGRWLALLLVVCLGCEVKAFPEAEGPGAASLGGRAGRVLYVTSLADSGPGTLRAALEAEGARTVIFRVGGTITLQTPLVIRNPYVTVAGQTAPGGGIQLRNDPVAPYGLAGDSFTSLVIASHDVVIRFLRIRPGPLTPNPACRGPNSIRHPEGYSTCTDAGDIQALAIASSAESVMLDHLSLAWASDEIVDIEGPADVTLQWSMVSEGMDFVLYEGNFGRVLPLSGHGVITGDSAMASHGERVRRLAFHHDLFALLADRAPQLTVNCESRNQPLECASDVVNNYVYGWSEGGAAVANVLGNTYVNVVANFFREGPDTTRIDDALTLNDWGKSSLAIVPGAALGVHVSGNSRRSRTGGVEPVQVPCARWNAATRGWVGCSATTYAQPAYATAPITTTSASVARDEVLADAGASRRLDSSGRWVPARDATDVRVVNDARVGSGRMIRALRDFPGWPTLANGTAPADTDKDGMPDVWERSQGCLESGRPDGAVDSNADGYTNLEEFLNGRPACPAVDSPT